MSRKTTTLERSATVQSPIHSKFAPSSNGKPDGQAHKAESVSEEIIRLRAYQKWEVAGKPAGDGAKFWLEAEQELLLPKKVGSA